MMRKVVVSVLLGSLLVCGTASTALADAEAPEKAVKYHDVLRKRPQPGYLFDRFYNAWLDEASVDSLAEFLTARASDPGESADRLLLAFFYTKQGEDRRAIEQFRTTLADDPGNAGAWYEKAVVEARSLDFETALADLKAASEAKPQDKLAVQIAKLRGQLLVRNRQRDEAIKVWQALAAERPDDEELAEDLIELEIGEGLYPEAIAALQVLIERTKDPYQKVVRRLRMGDIQQLGGSRDDSLSTYQTTLELVGVDSWLEREILAQIEQVFRREDDIAGLRKQYEQLLETYPKRIGLRRAYARVLSEAGDNDSAIAQFEEILKLVPGDRANREAFINLLTKAEKLPAATKQLEALVAQHPDDPELQVRLAQVYFDAKQADQAAEAVQNFLKASDQSEYAYLRAARMLEKFELQDQAKASYAELVKQAPESISAREAQAAFLYRIDDKDAAKTIWRELAQTDDVNQVVRVAKTASARHENELAYELLVGAHEHFADESLFLAQLIDVAMSLKKIEEAVPWAEQRVELAETTNELENAILQAAKVIERAEQDVAIIERLKTLDRPSVQQVCLLAELLENLGDSQQANAVLASLGERGGLLAASQEIRLATARRDWPKAAEATQRLLQMPGGRKSQYVRRLVEYYQRDYRIAEALRWVTEWKKLAPGSISPWMTESRLLQLDGKEDEAIDALRAAAREFEENTEIRIRLAQMYSQAGKLSDAERIYWQQYETSENLSDKLRWAEQLAQVAEQQGKAEQLIENFQERRRTNRGSIVPLLALAQIYRVTDNYEGRRQALTAATKIKPDDQQLLLQIARIEEQEGDWQRALATLQRAVGLDKTNSTRQRIARLHIEYGNPEDGFALLYELAGGEQSDPRDIELIADAMCGADEWEKAIEFLQRHVGDHPQDYRLQYLMGVACSEADDLPRAIEAFTYVLDAEQELPDVKPLTVTNSYDYFSMLAPLVPSETLEMIRLSQLKYTIQQHRQQRNSGVLISAMGGGGMTSSISMPRDLEQAQSYALASLVYLSEYMDDEGIDELAESLKQHGIDNGKLLIAATSGEAYQGADPVVLLEEFPDDPAALAYALIRGGFGQSNLDDEITVKAYQVFRESRPQLSVLAALTAASSNTEHVKLLDEAMQVLDSIEQPNTMLVMALCSHLGGTPGSGQQVNQLPDKYRQLLSDKLVLWYPKLQNPQQYGAWVFLYISGALHNNESPNAYLTFLEDEAARYRSQTSRQRQINAPFGNTQQEFLALPAWPPQRLADFSGLLLQTLNRNAMQYFPVNQEAGKSWDQEKYLAHVKQVKDPVLKLLLMSDMEDVDAAIDATLDELLADETPTLDVLLLGAGWKASTDKHIEASRLLQKARYLPMTREIRRTVDSALVALATEHLPDVKKVDKDKADQAETDDVLEAGRMAALRLRHNRLQSDQRLSLIAALEELGLKQEAEKLDKEESLATQPSVGAAAVAAYRSAGTQPPDRIRKLIDSGKRETAARALANELTGLVRQASSMGQNAYHFQYQYNQYRDRLKGYGLMDDVLATLDPGDSQNFRKLGDFAMVNEILKRSDEAIENYRAALELREDHDPYRVRLLFLLSKKEGGVPAEQFEKLTESAGTMLAGELMGRLQFYEFPVSERLDAVEVVVQYLESLDVASDIDISWADTICQAVASQVYHRSGQLPPLYVEKSQQVRNRSGVSEELTERRAKLHERLCRSMLRHDSVASKGFSHLLAAATANEEVDDEFVTLATDILQQKPEQRRKSAASTNLQVSYSSNYDAGTVPFRSPAEFLVRHAFQTQDWTTLEEQVVPAIEQSEQADKREELEQLTTLYQCPAEAFLTAAEEYTRRRSKQASPNPYMNTNQVDATTVVIDAWRDRELQVDLLPLLKDSLEKLAKMPNYYQMPSFAQRYAEALASAQQLDALDNWLETLAEIHIGPKNQRDALIKKHFNRQSITWNTPNGRMHVLSQFLGPMIQNPDLAFPIMRFVNKAEVTGILSNYEHYCRQGVQSLFQREPDEIVTSLASTGLLADYEDFDPGIIPDGAATNSLYKFVAIQARGLSGDRSKQFIELLKGQGADRFGVRLVLASMAKEEDQRVELLQHVGSQFASIQSLDESQQRKISAGLQLSVSAVRSKNSKLSEEAQTVVDWVLGTQADRAKSAVEDALKAKRLEELQVEYHEVEEWLNKHVPPLVETSPEQAVKVFFKIVDLVEEQQRRTRNNYYGEESLAGALLARMHNRGGQANLDAAAFTIDILLDKRGNEIQLPSWGANSYTNAIQNSFNQARQPRKKGEKADRKAETFAQLQQWYQQLQEALGDRPTTILAPAFIRVMQQVEVAYLPEVATWAREQSSEGSPGELALEIAAAAELVAAERERQKEKNTDGKSRLKMAPYHEYYLSTLQDESKSLGWRMEIVRFLYDQQREKLPQTLVEAALEMAVPVLNETLPFERNLQQRMIHDLANLVSAGNSLPETLAMDFVNAWRDRYLRPRTSRQTNTRVNLYQANNSTTMTLMLKLYQQLGEEESINRLLRNYEQPLSQRPDAIGLLVRAGELDRAAQFIRRGWNECELHAVSSGHAVYDAQLQEQLPAFYEIIKDDDLRYFAEGIIVCLNDPDPIPDEAFVQRETRQQQFAERFNSIEFKTDGMKRRLLLLLASRGTVPPPVADSLEEEAGKVDLTVVSNSNYSLYQKSQELVMAYLKFSLKQGNTKPAAEALSRLVKSNERNDWQIRNAINALQREVTTAFKNDTGNWQPEAFLTLAPLMSEMATTPQDLYLNDRNEIHAIVVASYLLGNQSDEYFSWLKELKPEQRKLLEQYGVSTMCFDIVGKSFGEATDDNLSARVAAVTQLARMLDEAGWLALSNTLRTSIPRQNQEFINSVTRAKLLNKKELLEHGPEIADAQSSGAIWAALAGLQQQEKKWADAAHSWQQVAKLQPEKETEKRQRAQLKFVDALHRSGKQEQARQELATLDAAKLVKNLTKEYENVQKRINENSSNAEQQSENKKAADSASENAAQTDQAAKSENPADGDQALAWPQRVPIIEYLPITGRVDVNPIALGV